MELPIARPAALGLAAAALVLVSACDKPMDFDLRGHAGAFSTANAVQSVTTNRPPADERGVISYPNYQVAVARRNDTVNTIATRVGLPAGELARYNGIDSDVKLRAGEIIALPRRVAAGTGQGTDIAALAGSAIDNAAPTSSVITSPLEPAPAPAAQSGVSEPVRHKVVRGETAYTISRLYNVPIKALAEWNGLSSDFSVREGQYLLIPSAGVSAPRREAGVSEPGAGSPTPTPPSAAKPVPEEKTAAKAPEPPKVALSAPTAVKNTRMGFPVQGKIVRAYAKGRNDGIDIAAASGAPVSAAANGTVAAITSSADKVPILVVRHPDNLLTVYANVDKIKVQKGDSVKRGQQIAQLRAGDNSYVHFEVRNGFESVDPMPYLE
ncbi:LysM peptidoglycan-binding domain-containing protein [Pontibaca salina]|nr:LysM peptidoglycan-binding domain-containing protein [Pontibaca salina]